MKSTDNGFNILEILLENKEFDISLSDIIRKSGLKRVTVTRIVTSLKKGGYLRQLKKKGKYIIGPRLLYLNRLINQKINMTEIVHPFLTRLSQAVDESVIFFSWDGERIHFLEEVYTKYPLKIVPDPRSVLPMHCSSVGKIFLAQMTDQELHEYYKMNELHPFTVNTITNINILKKHLKKVGKKGVAFDYEEQYLGIRSVAAGIRNIDDKITFCLAVIGPSVRMTRERLAKIVPDVKHYAMDIAEEIRLRYKKT